MKAKFPVTSELRITTQHDQVLMDAKIASPEILGASGVAFAVVGPGLGPGAALRSGSFKIVKRIY